MENKNYSFLVLNNINCKAHIEKKNGLSYLSWAWAWAEVKKVYPRATYTIYENKDGWNYHTDGRTAWVKTGVTIEGIEHIEDLPVMDNRNNSIPLEKVTSTDVNKAIQRSLTKACARHGLGLYVYAGEDLPEDMTAVVPAAYRPCDEAMYRKFVEAEARGQLTPKGRTALEAWANMTNAGAEELRQFNNDVIEYRINNSI